MVMCYTMLSNKVLLEVSVLEAHFVSVVIACEGNQ